MARVCAPSSHSRKCEGVTVASRSSRRYRRTLPSAPARCWSPDRPISGSCRGMSMCGASQTPAARAKPRAA